MHTKLIWANLMVDDLERTRRFYTALGFKQNGEYSGGDLLSFQIGRNDFVINFCARKRFEENIADKAADLNNGQEILFSISAANKEEVEQWAQAAKDIGAKIFLEPHAYQSGYQCGFADPDGHKYNVLYWPGME
ncbi:MAG: VOC family protein [Chitinophagaceae bacterium]